MSKKPAVAEMAKDLSTRQLHGIQSSNASRFESLDWTGVEEEVLVIFFPINERKYGRLHPPPSYLYCAQEVRKWRRFGNKDQQHKIQQCKEQQEQEQERQRGANGRGSRRRRRGGEAVVEEELAVVSTAKKRKYNTTPSSSPAPMFGEGGGGDDDRDLDRMVPRRGGESPPRLNRRASSFDEDVDLLQQQVLSSTCRGVSTTIIDGSNIRDKETVKTGLANLVGNVFRFRASFLSRNQAVWPYGRDVAGFIVNPNSKADGDDNFTWKCIEVDDDPERIVYSFTHKECLEKKDPTKLLCSTCEKSKYQLFAMCRREVKQRETSEEEPILQGRHGFFQYKSPSLILPHIKALANQITVLRAKLWRRENALKALVSKEVVLNNVNPELLFDQKTLEAGYQKLQGQLEVDEKEIFDVLFRECFEVHKRIKLQGNAKGHKYSPLLIRFAIMLRNKVSQSNYDFFRQVFGLPTNATLCEYRSADTTAEDGVMHETCSQQSIAMHKLNVPRGDFRWYMALSFDSHTIKEMLGKFDGVQM